MSSTISAAATGLPALTRRKLMTAAAAIMPAAAALSPVAAMSAPIGEGAGRIFELIAQHAEVWARFPGATTDAAVEDAWYGELSVIEDAIGRTALSGLDEATAALRFVLQFCEGNQFEDWSFATLENVAAALGAMQAA